MCLAYSRLGLEFGGVCMVGWNLGAGAGRWMDG